MTCGFLHVCFLVGCIQDVWWEKRPNLGAREYPLPPLWDWRIFLPWGVAMTMQIHQQRNERYQRLVCSWSPDEQSWIPDLKRFRGWTPVPKGLWGEGSSTVEWLERAGDELANTRGQSTRIVQRGRRQKEECKGWSQTTGPEGRRQDFLDIA